MGSIISHLCTPWVSFFLTSSHSNPSSKQRASLFSVAPIFNYERKLSEYISKDLHWCQFAFLMECEKWSKLSDCRLHSESDLATVQPLWKVRLNKSVNKLNREINRSRGYFMRVLKIQLMPLSIYHCQSIVLKLGFWRLSVADRNFGSASRVIILLLNYYI